MRQKLFTIFHNQRLIRYFFVAISIVCIELVLFQVIFLLTSNYTLGTVFSFILAVVLNWLLGRKFVFGASSRNSSKEFTMVLGASVIGLVIQLGVVFGSVELIGLYPLIGKGLSILFSFFWNYWFRANIIYK